MIMMIIHKYTHVPKLFNENKHRMKSAFANRLRIFKYYYYLLHVEHTSNTPTNTNTFYKYIIQYKFMVN